MMTGTSDRIAGTRPGSNIAVIFLSAGIASRIFAVVNPGAADTGEIEFRYINSCDSSKQIACAYVPAACIGRPSPLLAVTHCWGADRCYARDQGYYRECTARGWIAVCPQQHGHRTDNKTALASIESQHDVVDAIAYLRQRYRIDRTRIYVAGRSMGGMAAQMMAAKYPDLFAAAMAAQGISDLKPWIDASPRFKEGVEAECGAYSVQTKFEYDRRSSVNYASNLAYVPLIMWHGTNDTRVPPAHTENLYKRILEHAAHPVPPFWLFAAPHNGTEFPVSWECEQLGLYRTVAEAGMEIPQRFFPELNLVTDESKRYFWVNLTLDRPDAFGTVRAVIRNDSLVAACANLRGLTVDVSRIARGYEFSHYAVTNDRVPMRLAFVKGDSAIAAFEFTGAKAGDVRSR